MGELVSEVYNGDCMEYMARFDDGFFDLAIVDPPYAVGASDGTFGNRKKTSTTRHLKHYANKDSVPDETYFEQLFRVSKNQIIWGSNYYPEHLYHSGAIIWHKKTQGPLSDCEVAFQSFNKVVKYFYHEWNGFLKGSECGKKRIHPNQKPVALYEWLLKNYAKMGDKILDTHMGSQSSRIACYRHGFDFWGSELDEEYFKIGCDNFKAESKQPLLLNI